PPTVLSNDEGLPASQTHYWNTCDLVPNRMDIRKPLAVLPRLTNVARGNEIVLREKAPCGLGVELLECAVHSRRSLFQSELRIHWLHGADLLTSVLHRRSSCAGEQE